MENKKKGMIFGKINVIDLIIIILVICAAAFVAFKFLGVGNSAFVNTRTVLLTFYAEESPDYVSPNSEVGDAAWDFDNKMSIGRVTDIRTDEAVSFEMDSTGNLYRLSKEGYESVYITVETKGTVTETGVIIGSSPYAVGHSVVVYAGDGKYFMKVYSIEIVD